MNKPIIILIFAGLLFFPGLSMAMTAQEFESKVKGSPDDWEIYLEYGNQLGTGGDYTGAQAVFERAKSRPKIQQDHGKDLKKKIFGLEDAVNIKMDPGIWKQIQTAEDAAAKNPPALKFCPHGRDEKGNDLPPAKEEEKIDIATLEITETAPGHFEQKEGRITSKSDIKNMWKSDSSEPKK